MKRIGYHIRRPRRSDRSRSIRGAYALAACLVLKRGYVLVPSGRGRSRFPIECSFDRRELRRLADFLKPMRAEVGEQ